MLKNFVTRALSGLLFVVIMLACIWKSDFFYGGLFLFITIFGLIEFYKMVNKKEGVAVYLPLAVAGGALLFITSFMVFFIGYEELLLSIDFIYLFVLMAVELFRNQRDAVLNIAHTMMGYIYVALPISLLTYVESYPEFGKRLLICFFIIIWASDTGAYLAGVCFGKHKMFERISPKKTWEGFAGGLAFAFLCGFIFCQFSIVPYTMLTWFGISAVIFVFGVLGDLVESMMKRNVGVKDSGNFMPGHGGLLDRFDSALFAAPVLFMISLLLLNC